MANRPRDAATDAAWIELERLGFITEQTIARLRTFNIDPRLVEAAWHAD